MSNIDEMLRSPDMSKANLALRALRSMPAMESVRLLERLALEANPDLRARALDAMIIIWPERGKTLAMDFARDTDANVRVFAVHGLIRLDDITSVPLLKNLLESDPDDLVRSWSAFGLGVLGDESTLEILRQCAERDIGQDHEGRPIRDTCLAAIEKINARQRQD